MNPVEKVRLDQLLVQKGCAESRERARALILGGKVWVRGEPATKPGVSMAPDMPLEIRGLSPYVSRGGIKLDHALKVFGIEPRGQVCLDVGASTGGFTDCLLQAGAHRVYAVDVGYGQFAWRLRQDPRVILVERQNIRYWDGKELQDPLDLAVIDVSFISLTLVLPKVMDLMERRGEIVALVKPQFEVGRGEVGKGGVVRSAEKQEAAIQKIKAAGEGLSLHFLGVAESPIQGPKGNREFFLHFRPA